MMNHLYNLLDHWTTWRFKSTVFTFLILLTPLFLNAALVSWTGNGDGVSWNDASNWDSGAVPSTTDDLIVVGCWLIVVC